MYFFCEEKGLICPPTSVCSGVCVREGGVCAPHPRCRSRNPLNVSTQQSTQVGASRGGRLSLDGCCWCFLSQIRVCGRVCAFISRSFGGWVCVCAGVCVCARPPSLPSYTHPQIMLGLALMSGLQSKGRGDDNILGRLLLPLSSVDFKHFLCSLFRLLFLLFTLK